MATVDDEAFLGAEMLRVRVVPVVELHVNGVTLLCAEGAGVTPEAAVDFLDVAYDRFALGLNHVASRTLELAFALFSSLSGRVFCGRVRGSSGEWVVEGGE